MITLEVPTFVMLSKKTMADEKVILNFNTYRNMNRFKLGHVKNAFYDQFKPEMDRIKWEYKKLIEVKVKYYHNTFNFDFVPEFKLIYTITSANQRKFDIANMLSIIDKFACDCLVKDGFMEDDNWEYLGEVVYKFGWTANVGENEYGKVDIEVIKYICHSNRLKLAENS